ncbi:MAG: Nitrilase/cyanide hydratase and apolipoprotein N-acyltransferase [Actinomycetia bacterium]|nr:Nitrilase/cyanide hydratase and apolipoprotein N-acyltransferase [Actinomycetes bacterium]
MRALLAQLASLPGDVAANAERAVAALAAHPEADIAVFPELFLCGYDLSLLDHSARRPDCEELRSIADAARAASTAVVVGFAERIGAGGLANSVACIDRDGSLAAVYRKTQLFGAEQHVFRPGEELRIVRLAGVDVGPLICFDIEFPEPARQLAAAGAKLLVTASANMDPFVADHELASRARALENRLPHLYANAVGAVGPLRFVGHSRSVDASGMVLAEAASEEEALLLTQVGAAGVGDERVDYLRHLPHGMAVVRD